MDKYQKQVEQTLLDNEKETFNELKRVYTNALKETKLMVKHLQADVDILEKANLENKSILQSKIYQLNYQKAMDEQLTGIMKMLETENVQNTQTFLTKMYEDSFLGMNYTLQQKGIPVITPINHKLIVKTINKPIEDLNFKDRMYRNNKEFKKTVKAEISRGIATGASYKEIAQQLSLATQVDLNKTMRIVRTEGGRVSSEAKYESMMQAKKVGADIVKQWDATLDGKTRYQHAKLDQQWVELNKPFKVDGMEAMYPHGFGRADMDCNCRCVLLSVPRWDLEGEVTKYDNSKGYLVKTKNYQEWKNGYYTKVKELDIVETVIEEATNRITGYQKTAKAVSDKVDKVLGKNKVQKEYNITYKDSLQGLDIDLLEENKRQLNELVSKFPNVEKYVDVNGLGLGSFDGTYGDFGYTSSRMIDFLSKQEINLNIKHFANYEEHIASIKEYIKNGWSMPCSDEFLSTYTLTHEFGHVLHNVLINEYWQNNREEYWEKWETAKQYDPQMASYMMRQYHGNLVKKYLIEIQDIAIEKDPDFAIEKYLSDYGRSDYSEAFAEIFANSQCGKPNLLGESMNEWLEKRFK